MKTYLMNVFLKIYLTTIVILDYHFPENILLSNISDLMIKTLHKYDTLIFTETLNVNI